MRTNLFVDFEITDVIERENFFWGQFAFDMYVDMVSIFPSVGDIWPVRGHHFPGESRTPEFVCHSDKFSDLISVANIKDPLVTHS